MDVDALLNVVREVEVGVEELVAGTLALRVERMRADEEEPEERQREATPSTAAERGKGLRIMVTSWDQKFISRLMWNTVPFAPTGYG